MSLSNSTQVQVMPWSRAVKLLTSQAGYNLRSKCLDIVRAANTRAKSMAEDDAVVLLVSYAFADPVIGGGNTFALPTSCGCSPKSFGLGDGVPVCLVMKNALEVYLPSKSPLIDMPQSLRLLQPGDLFGVFEAADRMCRIGHQRDDWQVVAGARTSRLLYPFENKALLHHLKKALATYSPKLNEVIGGALREKQSITRAGLRGAAYLEDWTWELLVAVYRLGCDADRVLAVPYRAEESASSAHATDDCRTNWRAEVLVFPPQWLKPTGGGLAFQCEVLKSAWRQVRDDLRRGLQRQAIESASKQVAAIRDLVNQEKTSEIAVRQLLLCLDDVVSRRAVAYVPCTDFSTDIVRQAGPFDQLVPVIHRHLRRLVRNSSLQPAIMVPTYLSAGAAGYVSFNRPTTLSAAELVCNRMPEMLSAVAEQIPHAKTGLEELIPGLDWCSLRFYANFQAQGTHYLKLSSLTSAIGQCVHCTNRYFHHCACVVARS